MNDEVFFQLVRFALGMSDEAPAVGSEQEWRHLYDMARSQALVGVAFEGVKRITKGQKPSLLLLSRWVVEAEQVAKQNAVLTEACRKLTKLFGERGRDTAILKGQANARLYPVPASRQPGDIDIWVSGGKKSVLSLLKEMDLPCSASYHHAHLKEKLYGAIVEVHFRPSSGNHNPVTNRRLQRLLKDELQRSAMCEEGFYVPTKRFSLFMQLAHIQRHFLDEGVGLRQIVDFLMLLKSEDEAACLMTKDELRQTGLVYIGGALMWVLQELFGLERGQMICEPDVHRGRILLGYILKDGNFGRNAKFHDAAVLVRVSYGKIRRLRLLAFNPWEAIWGEVKYWVRILTTIPERIEARSLSLRDVT